MRHYVKFANRKWVWAEFTADEYLSFRLGCGACGTYTSRYWVSEILDVLVPYLDYHDGYRCTHEDSELEVDTVAVTHEQRNKGISVGEYEAVMNLVQAMTREQRAMFAVIIAQRAELDKLRPVERGGPGDL